MDISIDWSTATVTRDKERLTLEIELTDEPDTFWKDEFTRLRDDQPLARDFMPSTPYSTKMNVHGIGGAEAVEDVRRQLDELVAQANVEAVRARREWETKETHEAERTEALDRKAEEITKGFRGEN